MPTAINLVPNNTGSAGVGSTLGTEAKKWDNIFAGTGSIDAISSSNGTTDIFADLLVRGDADIRGNLTFGNSTSDSITFGAEVSSSIIPDANDSYDLGNYVKAWSKVYTDDLYLTGSSGAIYQAGTKRLTLGATNTFVGNISASGGISASQLTTYDDITLKYNADGGDTLVRIYDSSDDGIIDVYQNNSITARIHGYGESFIRGGGLVVSGSTGYGSNITASGKIDSWDEFRLIDTNESGDTLARIYASSDDGIIDVYQNNSVKNRIHGYGQSYFTGGSASFGTTNDSGKQLTVAGDISASGNLNVQQITASIGTFSNLPSSPVGIPTGSLYTLSGSQLGMEISSSFLGNPAKIILIK